MTIAFSSEGDTGWREENALEQKVAAFAALVPWLGKRDASHSSRYQFEGKY
jgi:hypothetical protein